MIALLGFALVAQVQGVIPTWTLSPTPTLTIEDDGTPATQFVRIVGVARLSNGSIAVANRGTNDIRVFDARGRHVATFGRTGEGPGEFRRLDWVGRSGDTLWFFDSGVMRVTGVLVTARAELAGITRIIATGNRGSFRVTGRLADGRFVATTNVSPTFEGSPGVHRYPGSAGIIVATGDGEVNWLGDFKSAANFVHNPTGDVKQAATGPIAFSPWLYSATTSGHVWIGDSGGDSVVVVRGRDLSRVTIRVPFDRRVPSRELVNKAREEELALNKTSPVGKAFTEAKFSAKYLPELLPFFESLLPGFQDEVWILEYTGNRQSPAKYIVLDANGRPKGSVTVPGGSRIREVGLDYVILVHQDQDEVESVRVHRLQRRLPP
jgi:hypothetical protein